MKPLKSEVTDSSTLEELGRASVQIVHDLKNQLNGLKLYATFLRKRMEKAERPEDERETVAKLIQGLERAASDMTTLVRLGRPVELRRQAGVNLSSLLAEAANGTGALDESDSAAALEGEFDAAALSEAFKAIHTSASTLSSRGAERGPLEVSIKLDESESKPQALIEWRGLKTATDPFHSYAGSDALRMSLAAKIIEAHGGVARYEDNTLSVRLPIEKRQD
ncbi:MAG: HAMP domain-containing histidine kinase [Pyrinomonadaceae bacterium]|nr:HAMP domain-containing histidine kinase [Pyrinomonadaceae bacterium]